MIILSGKHCPKCSGNVAVEKDNGYWRAYCIRCGWDEYTAVDRTKQREGGHTKVKVKKYARSQGVRI